MTATAAVLIFTSAFMHAFWNFVSKRRSPTLAFFWLAATAAAVALSPLLVVNWQMLSLIPAAVWRLIALTGLAQLVYFFGLAGAYRQGDISLAYPLARALPVLLVAAISLLLGTGGEIGAMALLGMALIMVGCIILPLSDFQTVRLRDYFNALYLMVVVAALGTTGYTLIDDHVLRELRMVSNQMAIYEVTLLFMALQTLSTAVMLGLGTLLYKPERRRLLLLVRDRSLLVTGLLTGIVVTAAYGLALAAMAFVSNVSYVAAFRQLSIPMGALLGFTLGQEPRYRPKTIGIAIVSGGLILVGIG